MDTRKETPGPGMAPVESVPVMSIAGDVCRVGYWPQLNTAITNRTRTPTIRTVAHHSFASEIHISTTPNTTYSANRKLKIPFLIIV